MSEVKETTVTVQTGPAATVIDEKKVEVKLVQPTATPVVEAPKVAATPEVNTATNTIDVKVEAPKNRLIDGAVDALNKNLDFRV